MYRVHFDPKTGWFILQVSSGLFSMFWTTIMETFAEAPADAPKVRQYATYAEAQKFATESGLATLYVDRSANNFRAHMGR